MHRISLAKKLKLDKVGDKDYCSLAVHIEAALALAFLFFQISSTEISDFDTHVYIPQNIHVNIPAYLDYECRTFALCTCLPCKPEQICSPCR